MTSKTPNYIPSLDGMRAVSIAIVFAGHAGVSDLIPGGFGVTVFFFLSGFLITTLFVNELEKYGSISLKAFFLRRLLRLSPPLFVSLLVIYIAVAIGLSPGRVEPMAIISQALYFHNYYQVFDMGPAGAKGTVVLWSLAVEEHFYLIWPFIFWGLARGWLGLSHIAGLLVAILAWRCIRMMVLGDTEWNIYISTDTRFDSILYGCFLALLDWKGLSKRIFPQGTASMLITLGVALGVILFCFVFRDPLFRSTLRYSLLGLALMVVFYYAVHHSDFILFRPLNWAVMRRIGLYSYTVYLVHYVIIATLIYQGVPENNVPVIFILTAVISIVYADLLLRYVEAPFKRMRGRLTGH